MANEFSQQISPAEALAMATLGPQESPIASGVAAPEFQQKFEVSEITALLATITREEKDGVYVYFAYDADRASINYKWLNGALLCSRELDPSETDPTVDSDHVEFLTTMSEDPSQVYPHQISAQKAAELKSLGFQRGLQGFHASGLFALLATIEEQPAVDGKKWAYVYYAYDQDWSLTSVILGCRPVSPEETSALKDPLKVEFLEHTNEYPMP